MTTTTLFDEENFANATEFLYNDTIGWPWECSGTTDEANDENCYPKLEHFVRMLDLYLIPVIVAIGVLGNLVSFLVFTCTYLSRISSSVYLAALAVVDSTFLIVLFFTWLTNVGVQVYHQHGWCQFFVYATYVASFLSVWYIVCFTVERYLTIRFPLKRQQICKTGRAKAVVVSLAVLALALYCFAIWTSEVATFPDYPFNQPFCQPRYHDLVLTINNADTLVTLIVPSVIIVASNIRICYALSRFYRAMEMCDQRATTLSSSSYSSTRYSWARSPLRSRNGQSSSTIYSNSSYNRLQMKVTKMLVIVSTVFLICNIPSHAVRVYVFIKSSLDADYIPGHLLVLVQKLIQHLFYANFATNFLLYSVTGETFRRATCRLVWCVAHRTANWLRRKHCWRYPDALPGTNLELAQKGGTKASSGAVFGLTQLMDYPYN